MNEPDPCGCHETQAEHDAVVQETLIAETSMETGGMEFGNVHIHSHGGAPFFLLGLLIGFVLLLGHLARKSEFTIITLSHLRPVRHARRSRVQKMMRPIPLRMLKCETRCAYCHDSIPPSHMLNCPGCRTLHHKECFSENGCSTFGCRQLQPSLVTIES